MTNMKLEVSVVIPTFKRPELLSRCIAALFAQDYDNEKFEIIIVDDGIDEKTKKTVAMWQAQILPKVRYIQMAEHSGPGAARNIGWKSAEAPVIAFTDDDTIPDSHWLIAGVNALTTADCVTGRVVVPISDPPTDNQKNIANLETAEFVTANCFCRKEVLLKVGGFDENFKMAWREDSDLQFRIEKAEYSIVHESSAIVIHPVREAQFGVSIKEQKKTMYNALLYKKHPEMYKERIQSSPPIQYYGIIATFLIAIAGIMYHKPILSTIAFVLWFFLTLQFFVKRMKGTSHSLPHTADMAVTSLVIPFLSVFWRLIGALKYRVFFW